MKPLIIANWKLNPKTRREAQELFSIVKKEIGRHEGIEVVICPPVVFLPFLAGLPLGGQDVFYKNEGAFTGAVSPAMLKDAGADYVMVGHSEVREFLHETSEAIARKIKAALDEKLKVIFCVGEKEGQEKAEVLEKQITDGLAEIKNLKLKIRNLAIAYEPVWAIGTGKNCSVDETMSSLMLIRKIIADMAGREAADAVRVLYGGSVKADNAAPYVRDAGANGLLVGGASLDPEEFIKIVKSVSN